MTPAVRRLSIFSRSIELPLFAAYFLGAIVPLAALAYLTQTYVLPELTDPLEARGLVGLVSSVSVLSLVSYLVVRQTATQTLSRMATDNERLAALLEAAQELSSAPPRSECLQVVASCARRLVGEASVFVLSREKDDEQTPFQVQAQSGGNAAGDLEAYASEIEEAFELALAGNRTVVNDDVAASGTGARAKLSLFCLPIGERSSAAVLLVLAARHRMRQQARDEISTLAGLGVVAIENSRLQDLQRNFFSQITLLLLTALDNHLQVQEGHSRRVAHISTRIGHELDLDERVLHDLHFAALLHDIGMLRIPREKLDDSKAIRAHPVLGQRMLASIEVWKELAPLVHCHHEWFDGSGYPDQLEGDAIPLESRIIGLAEAVDSMVSETSYKDAVSVDEMVQRVEEASGTQFDPGIARVFLELLERGELEF